MSYIGLIGTLSSIQRTKYKVFDWKIDGFPTWSQNVAEDSFYFSPNFTFKDLKDCWLRFYPNGERIKPGFIELSFNSEQHVVNSLYHLTLGVKTHSGRIDKWFSSYILFHNKDQMRFPSFKLKSEFLKRKEGLISSVCLTFVAILSSEEVNINRDVEDKTEACDLKEGEEEKKGSEKVLSDIAKLWDSGDGHDAVVLVDGTEFKVHSCILSARTPVFAALFEHDTLEKETRKVTIKDCEPAIFKEFLNHIYMGGVRNLNAENVFALYQEADKYLVKDLKEVCGDYIQDNLSSETFCEAVQLALMCGDNDLLEYGFEYFASNFRLIIRSVEWQRFIKENPIEANEILVRSFGPP